MYERIWGMRAPQLAPHTFTTCRIKNHKHQPQTKPMTLYLRRRSCSFLTLARRARVKAFIDMVLGLLGTETGRCVVRGTTRLWCEGERRRDASVLLLYSQFETDRKLRTRQYKFYGRLNFSDNQTSTNGAKSTANATSCDYCTNSSSHYVRTASLEQTYVL